MEVNHEPKNLSDFDNISIYIQKGACESGLEFD